MPESLNLAVCWAEWMSEQMRGCDATASKDCESERVAEMTAMGRSFIHQVRAVICKSAQSMIVIVRVGR